MVTPIETIKKSAAKAKRESLEKAMALQFRASGLEFAEQVKFHPTRRWRMDFVVAPGSNCPIGIEVQGGTFSGGRHTRGVGYEADCEKLAHAQIVGYRVLYVTAAHIKTGQALAWVLELLGATCRK